jgi:CelD/BcsL family acetyltransferase involved in cellulose biosynthesis
LPEAGRATSTDCPASTATRSVARPGVALRQVDRDDLTSAVDTFVSLHRTSPGDKGEFFDRPGMKEFFHALVGEFGPEGEARIHELLIDGRPAAMTVSLVHARADAAEWGLYNSSYDQDHAALSPGMVLVAELIRIAAEEGCDTFDLLRGAEPYKYRFGAHDRRLRRVTIGREREAAA